MEIDIIEAGKGMDMAIGEAIIRVAEQGQLSKELQDVVINVLLPSQINWREAISKAEGN